jgi:cytidine deaminase
VALFQADAHGDRKIQAIAVVTDTSPPSPPCGICRQGILELAGDIPVILANLTGEQREFQLSELLPEAFSRKFL